MLGKLKTEARKLKTVETGSAPGFWGAIRIWAGVPYVLYLWERIVVSVLAFIVLAIAEFVALRPLATGHKTDGDPRFIYGALVAGFVAIGLLALVGTIGKDPD